jgi:hypothetical protein
MPCPDPAMSEPPALFYSPKRAGNEDSLAMESPSSHRPPRSRGTRSMIVTDTVSGMITIHYSISRYSDIYINSHLPSPCHMQGIKLLMISVSLVLSFKPFQAQQTPFVQCPINSLSFWSCPKSILNATPIIAWPFHCNQASPYRGFYHALSQGHKATNSKSAKERRTGRGCSYMETHCILCNCELGWGFRRHRTPFTLLMERP